MDESKELILTCGEKGALIGCHHGTTGIIQCMGLKV